jgi:flagellar basal-body rod modification protein FlgD
MVTTVNNSTSSTAATSTGSTGVATQTADQMQTTFLKLLVAQINNQDPLNPVDNSQMTSQMAQINTVGGIQQLNTSLQGLVNQFSSMQMLQGSTLIGHTVTVPGNSLTVNSSTGQGIGAYSLPTSASSVQVQITDASGKVVGTINQGSQAAGQQTFSWDASSYPNTALTFKVVATNGSSTVTPTTYMAQTIDSVGMSSGALSLGLSNGSTVPYANVNNIY